jgi:hemerythrin superfamily protein
MKNSESRNTHKSPNGHKPDTDNNVIQLLHDDHRKVKEMFFQYEQLKDHKDKEELVKTILKELYVHSAAEEEIVYPAVRKQAEDADCMMDEADTEHHVVKVLITELSEMKATDDHYDAKVMVLGELVDHHVKEEEKEMFHKMEEAEMDLEKLAEKVNERKMALQAEPIPKISLPFKTNSRVAVARKR